MNLAPPHTVILASAGTGKTHALTNRFIWLIAAGESAENILATTFTRKAAGEILRKIATRLADGASSEAKAAQLGTHIGMPGITAAECLRLLAGVVRALDRLSVGTIDSFFAKLAAGNAFSLGAGEWRMIDDDEDANLRAEAVSRVLRSGDRAEILELVHSHRPGEARRSVHRDMLDAVNEAYHNLLSSDRDAWGAFVPPQAPGEAAVAAACTGVREMAVPVTQKGTPRKNWAQNKEKLIDVIDSGRWRELLNIGLVSKIITGENEFDRVEIETPIRAMLETLVAKAAATVLSTLPGRNMATRGMLERFHHAYSTLKTTRGLCTFEDVPRMLLKAGAATAMHEIYYRLDARVRHVLLDEFQDTSVVQWRMLEPLAEEIVSQGDDRSLLAVGDIKQSLYAWRNAEPELLAGIPRRWEQVKLEQLAKSYRSSPIVIDAVNEVMGNFEHNLAFSGERATPGTRRAVERWRQMFAAHTTAMENLPGYCRVSVTPEKTDTETVKDAAMRVAAERIRDMHRAAPHRSIGVLFRSRKPIAAMKLELAKHGIQASEEGGNPLADSPGVAAVLSMLTLADHPANSAALFHVATSPLGPLVGVRFNDAAETVARAASKVRLRLLAEGFGGLLEDWLRQLAPFCSEREAHRLDQLVTLGVAFDARSNLDPATRASAFVEYVRRRRVEDPTAAPVRLMTIHASKGLEFDSVVLLCLDEAIAGRKPAVLEDRPDDDPLAAPSMVTLCPTADVVALDPVLQRLYERWRGRQVLEAFCVLYVALTRAVHALEIFVTPAAKSLMEGGSSLTFEKIIRGAFNAGPAIQGEVLWEHGDPEWVKRCDVENEPPLAPAAGADPDLPSLRLDTSNASRTRHVPRRTPSTSHEEATGDRDDDRDAARWENWSDLEDATTSPARLRGVLFHAWLEHIEWLDAADLSDEFLIRIARETPALQADIPALIREFRDSLERPNLRRVLTQSSFPGETVEVLRELPFSLAQQHGDGPPSLLTGRIDRLVIVRDARGNVDRAEMMDFKTDQLSDTSAAALHARAKIHRGQMNDYRLTVSRLLRCRAEQVRAKIVFITHDAVIEDTDE